MSPSTCRRRQVANAIRLLAATVVAAGIVAGCGGVPATRIVDGWLIGPPVTCADLGISRTGCERIVEAADAFAEARGGTPASWTIHPAAAVDAAGSPRLLELGSGVPDGVLLVRLADGAEELALIGCFQAISPRDPPGCP
jgi:hypothetical protein